MTDVATPDPKTPDPNQIWAEGSPDDEPAKPRKALVGELRPPRKPSRWLAVVGYGGLTLGCVALAGLGFFLVAAPIDILRDRVIEQVKARTGRDLAVGGPV